MSPLPNNMNIHDLTYPELEKLAQQISIRKQQLYPAFQESEIARYKKLAEQQEKRKKEFNKEILPKIKSYLILNLKQGDVIKVKGARDGKGIRQFLSFCDNGIECRQISIRKMINGSTIESLGQITQHMFDKVTHIKIDGKFIKIRDLIDK